MDTIALPTDLLPGDGRFGSGPSRVRGPQLDALVAVGETVLGTSHRQRPVRAVVGSVRERLATLLGAPDGYEVVLGNGGTTAWADGRVVGCWVQDDDARVRVIPCAPLGAAHRELLDAEAERLTAFLDGVVISNVYKSRMMKGEPLP